MKQIKSIQIDIDLYRRKIGCYLFMFISSKVLVKKILIIKSDEETLNRFYLCTRIVTQGHSKQLKTIQYSNKGKFLLIVYFLHMKTTHACLYNRFLQECSDLQVQPFTLIRRCTHLRFNTSLKYLYFNVKRYQLCI